MKKNGLSKVKIVKNMSRNFKAPATKVVPDKKKSRLEKLDNDNPSKFELEYFEYDSGV